MNILYSKNNDEELFFVILLLILLFYNSIKNYGRVNKENKFLSFIYQYNYYNISRDFTVKLIFVILILINFIIILL